MGKGRGAKRKRGGPAVSKHEADAMYQDVDRGDIATVAEAGSTLFAGDGVGGNNNDVKDKPSEATESESTVPAKKSKRGPAATSYLDEILAERERKRNKKSKKKQKQVVEVPT